MILKFNNYLFLNIYYKQINLHLKNHPFHNLNYLIINDHHYFHLYDQTYFLFHLLKFLICLTFSLSSVISSKL